MRILLTIIVGIFLVTFAWGWAVNVPPGTMDTLSYTKYYGRQVNDAVFRVIREMGKMIELVKKPLPERKEFKLNG